MDGDPDVGFLYLGLRLCVCLHRKAESLLGVLGLSFLLSVKWAESHLKSV